MSGPINDSHSPVDMPNNEWTRMVDAVRDRNARGASMPPDRGVPNVGTPMPMVRSASLGKPVEDVNRPLTSAEVEYLNQQALRSGLVTGPVNPSIAGTLGNQSEEYSQYGSLEDAIRAGAPVGSEEDAVTEGAIRFREPIPIIQASEERMTARQFVARNKPFGELLPQLPDFKKVQMIDMVNGKVYVDGIAFDLAGPELKYLRKFCITKAKEQIGARLDAALKALAEDTDVDGGSAEV